MKRFTKILCMTLAILMSLSITAAAAEVTPRASAYFSSYDTYLWETSSTSFQVWFEITAVRGMTELGVDSIEIERSSDGVNWTVVKTYDRDDYSNLIATNTAYHGGHVTYSNRQSGYQYRAYVDFYAKNSSGGRGYYGAYAYF